jgi:hypothetical protein
LVTAACLLPCPAKELPAPPCTVYSTQKFLWICIISSFTPLSNGWNDVLGKYLVKENCLKKMFEKIHICLHFNNTNSPILTALIVTSLQNKAHSGL